MIYLLKMNERQTDTAEARGAEMAALAATVNALFYRQKGGRVQIETVDRPAPGSRANKCVRCGLEWRTPLAAPIPGKCPRCKARKWQTPLPPRISDTIRLCKICGHTWKARKAARPGTCPNCHSPYWDSPEQMKRTPKTQKAHKTP